MKLKSLIFLLFSIVLFNSVNSQQIYPQDGIYGGIESGVAHVNINGTFSSIRSFDESSEFIALDYTKSVLSVNLGYGRYFEENIAGIEIHHSLYLKKISENFIQGNFEFDTSLGSKSEIDLVLGRKIGTHSLLTFRFGMAFTNINLIANHTTNIERYVLDKKWNGYSLGMGYVFGITDNLAIKSKYSLTNFRNNKFRDSNAKLVDNRFTLSLIYTIWTFY